MQALTEALPTGGGHSGGCSESSPSLGSRINALFLCPSLVSWSLPELKSLPFRATAQAQQRPAPGFKRCKGKFFPPSLSVNFSLWLTPFPRPSGQRAAIQPSVAPEDHKHLIASHILCGAEGSTRCLHKPGRTHCNSQPHISAWISGGPVPRLLLACTASFMLLTFPRNSKWQNRRYCNLELLSFVNWWEYWNVHVPYLTAPPAFLICCSAQPFRIHIRQLTSGLNIY